MDLQPKTPKRVRVANFTADEKALLANLVKNRPIIESKVTDGRSVARKQAAWEIITQEFNSNANVHKRETMTLKRAWDNMKALTRKARATARGNLMRTGGGPPAPPPLSQQGAIITLVEEAAPMMINEINNPFDSDGAILNAIENSQEVDYLEDNICIDNMASGSIEFIDMLDMEIKKPDDVTLDKENFSPNPNITGTPKSIDWQPKQYLADREPTEQMRRPTDYIRREAVMRLINLKNKTKHDKQLFDKQLAVEDLRYKAIAFENRMKQEKAALELEKLKADVERSKIELEKAILELEK